MSGQASSTVRPTVYRSAIDLWLALLLLMTPAVAIGFGVMLIRQGRPADAMTLFLMGTGFLLLTLLLTVPCRYTILTDSLSIRCGVLCYHVPLCDIRQVEKTISLWSGPALSVRRVRVVTEQRKYLISPADREAFLTDLQQAIQ